jgi:hypothetical protein
VLGYNQRQETAPWISKEVLELSDQQKQLKATRKTDEDSRIRYNKLTREIKKKSKECKSMWIEGLCQVVKDNARSQNARKLFKIANEICSVYCAKMSTVKNKTGQMIDEKTKTKNRWKEYCQELYNEQNPVDTTILGDLPFTNSAEHMENFLEEEVESLI